MQAAEKLFMQLLEKLDSRVGRFRKKGWKAATRPLALNGNASLRSANSCATKGYRK
jgi:hypothetical protein